MRALYTIHLYAIAYEGYIDVPENASIARDTG